MTSPLSGRTLRCWVGRHRWAPDTRFKYAPVRQCAVCGRVEHRTILSGWVRTPWLDGGRGYDGKRRT